MDFGRGVRTLIKSSGAGGVGGPAIICLVLERTWQKWNIDFTAIEPAYMGCLVKLSV